VTGVLDSSVFVTSSVDCQMEGISLTMTITTAEWMRTGSGVGGVRLRDPTESFLPPGVPGIGLQDSEDVAMHSMSPEICFLGEDRKAGVTVLTEGGKFLSKESMARSKRSRKRKTQRTSVKGTFPW